MGKFIQKNKRKTGQPSHRHINIIHKCLLVMLINLLRIMKWIYTDEVVYSSASKFMLATQQETVISPYWSYLTIHLRVKLYVHRTIKRSFIGVVFNKSQHFLNSANHNRPPILQLNIIHNYEYLINSTVTHKNIAAAVKFYLLNNNEIMKTRLT